MGNLRYLLTVLVGFTLFWSPIEARAERSAQSTEIGARDHPEILAQFGGEIADEPLSSYVERIGRKLVALTDERNEQWTFTVLDSPVVNALALPGGYVYVTRGLLAIANNEAELAGVLGHEIGHVLAGHGEARVKRSNQAGFGVIIGTIIGGVFGGKDGAADAIEFGAKLANGYLAQHSQSEELEADMLGVRLLAEAGYNPFAEADFLEQLAAKERLESKVSGQQHNPNRIDFFASHPATARRTRKAVEAARQSGLKVDDGVLNERQYLSQIDGIIYGDTARDGFIRGLRFSHPILGFTFSVPQGFILQNFPHQVVAQNGTGAQIVLSGDQSWSLPMEQFLKQRWLPQIREEVRVSKIRNLRASSVNGLDAARAMVDIETQDGAKIAQLTAIRFRNTTIRIFAITDRADGKTRNALNSASQSFRSLTPAEIFDLKPYRIRVRTVSRTDSVEVFARTLPETGFQEEQFKTMNGYENNSDMRPGDLVKVIE